MVERQLPKLPFREIFHNGAYAASGSDVHDWVEAFNDYFVSTRLWRCSADRSEN